MMQALIWLELSGQGDFAVQCERNAITNPVAQDDLFSTWRRSSELLA